jgi:hypothetical protein
MPVFGGTTSRYPFSRKVRNESFDIDIKKKTYFFPFRRAKCDVTWWPCESVGFI